METLFPTTITVRRKTGSYVNGVWTASSADSTFEGSAQPMSGKEIESLGIGRKDTGKIKIYSSSVLNVSKEGGTNSGDYIVYGGKVWEVIHELVYNNGLIPHYKYIAEYRESI